MTTLDPTRPSSPAPAVVTATGRPAYGPLTRLGGACLALAPVLFALGVVTTPPQDSNSSTDYAASLADDRFLTAVSADCYHYAWVLFAFGFLAVVALVPGRRGRVLVTTIAALGAAASVQLSGLLLSDYYLSSIVHHSDVATAAASLEDLGPSVDVWRLTGQLAALFVPLVFLALAWARAMSWWVAPLPLLFAVLIVVSLPAPVTFVVGVACFAPAYVAGYALARGGRGRPAAS